MEEDLKTQTSSEQPDPTLPSAYTGFNSLVLTINIIYFSVAGATWQKQSKEQRA